MKKILQVGFVFVVSLAVGYGALATAPAHAATRLYYCPDYCPDTFGEEGKCEINSEPCWCSVFTQFPQNLKSNCYEWCTTTCITD